MVPVEPIPVEMDMEWTPMDMELIQMEDESIMNELPEIPAMALVQKVNGMDIWNQRLIRNNIFHMTRFCKTATRMKLLIAKFYEKAVFDSEFAIRALVLMSSAGSLKVDGETVMDVLIAQILEDYAKWQAENAGSRLAFLGVAAFLCQAFTLGSIGDQPLTQIVEAHIEYQTRLLEPTVLRELELSVLMLVQNGKRISACLPADSKLLNNYNSKVTALLMASEPDSPSRHWLMVAHNFANNSYVTGPNFMNAYADLLEPLAMTRINCAIRANDVDPPIDLLDVFTAHDLLIEGGRPDPWDIPIPEYVDSDPPPESHIGRGRGRLRGRGRKRGRGRGAGHGGGNEQSLN